jgi:hypothetical protein
LNQNIFGTGEGWFNFDRSGFRIWYLMVQTGRSSPQLTIQPSPMKVLSQQRTIAATKRRSKGHWTVAFLINNISNGINGGSAQGLLTLRSRRRKYLCSLGIFPAMEYFAQRRRNSWTKIYTSAVDEDRIRLACAPGNANICAHHGRNGVDNVAGAAGDEGIKKSSFPRLMPVQRHLHDQPFRFQPGATQEPVQMIYEAGMV